MRTHMTTLVSVSVVVGAMLMAVCVKPYHEENERYVFVAANINLPCWKGAEAKFRVRERMELAFRAVRHSPAPMAMPRPFATREARGYGQAAPSYHNAPRVGLIALGKRHLTDHA